MPYIIIKQRITCVIIEWNTCFFVIIKIQKCNYNDSQYQRDTK